MTACRSAPQNSGRSPAEGPGAPPAIPFGKIFYETHGGSARRTIEDAARVSLQPSEVYAFVEDVGTRWPQLFSPGTHQLQVIDRAVTPAAESNVISVQVVFTEASMPKLFEIAERWLTEADRAWQSSEAGFIGEARQFAARWIAELQPGFRLVADANDPAAERQNRVAVAAARARWTQQAGSPKTLAKISEINRGAGQGSTPH